MYSSFFLPPQTHNPDPVITLFRILKPLKLLHQHHHVCQNITFKTHSKTCLINMMKYSRKREECKKVGNELVNIKSEILCLSKYTKVLKEKTNKFSSKIIEHENPFSKIITYF